MRVALVSVCALLLSLTVRAAETVALGEPGRTKFATFDAATGRLYIAHNTEVTVVDTRSMSVIGQVTGMNAVRAIALGPNRLGYVTSSRAATVTVFDTETDAVRATVPAGQDANAIVYDPVSHWVFAMNDDDGTITVIDTAHDRVIKTISLPGGEGLEAAAADGQGHVYVSHSAQHEVIRLDSRSARVDRHFPLPDCPDPSGLALDTADQRAFVSCLKGLLVVLDTRTGRTVATMPIGPGGQSVIYDAQRKRIYSANADTTLSVIEIDSPDKYHALPPIQTPPMARTAAEDPATGRLFLPVATTLLVVSP